MMPIFARSVAPPTSSNSHIWCGTSLGALVFQKGDDVIVLKHLGFLKWSEAVICQDISPCTKLNQTLNGWKMPLLNGVV
mgnify:CR=1 FL=1